MDARYYRKTGFEEIILKDDRFQDEDFSLNLEEYNDDNDPRITLNREEYE